MNPVPLCAWQGFSADRILLLVWESVILCILPAQRHALPAYPGRTPSLRLPCMQHGTGEPDSFRTLCYLYYHKVPSFIAYSIDWTQTCFIPFSSRRLRAGDVSRRLVQSSFRPVPARRMRREAIFFVFMLLRLKHQMSRTPDSMQECAPLNLLEVRPLTSCSSYCAV